MTWLCPNGVALSNDNLLEPFAFLAFGFGPKACHGEDDLTVAREIIGFLDVNVLAPMIADFDARPQVAFPIE
jgi:hypothetical protein